MDDAYVQNCMRVVEKDDKYDVGTSAAEGRDFLRRRGGSAPGVAATLMILQVFVSCFLKKHLAGL